MEYLLSSLWVQIYGKSKAVASVPDRFARGGGGALSEISGFFSHLRMPNGGEGDDSDNLFQRLAMHTDQNF